MSVLYKNMFESRACSIFILKLPTFMIGMRNLRQGTNALILVAFFEVSVNMM